MKPASFLKIRLFQNLPHRGRRGIALLFAVTTVSIIMMIAMQVAYDSTVEYFVNTQNVSRLKAYYAARSGIELSLLRIKIYQTAMSRFGKQLGANASMLDEIWKMPFAWPLVTPPELSGAEKDTFKKINTDSILDSSYTTTIEDEGSKIDLSDLVSPSKVLKENTRKQLLTIFQQERDSNEVFQTKYGNFQFEELINNIADWMSSQNQSFNNGDKRSFYSELNKGSADFPPNRGFRTIDEVRLVAGMNDDFFDLLKNRITIYGMKGINPNVASKEVLRSLDSGITDEVANEILKRRNDSNLGGAFTDAQTFWGFVTSKGARLETTNLESIPLVFESTFNFRIRSTGEYLGVTREIEVVVFDLNKVAKKLKEYVDKEKQDQEPTQPPGPTPSQGQQVGLPKGPPRIVYWSER